MHGRMRKLIGLYDIFYKGGSCTRHKMGNGNILGGWCMFSLVRCIIGFQIVHCKGGSHSRHEGRKRYGEIKIRFQLL